MENKGVKDIPIFFIMGRPRSGTTLLRTLFDAHPNVKIPPEFPILLPLYQKFKNVKDWDEKTILSFVDEIFNSPAFHNRNIGNLKIDRDTYTSILMALAHKGCTQDFLKSLNFSSFSLFPKKEITWIGDKNPIYSIYLKRFLKIFPEARFICIVRDYRDNFISMKGLSDLNLEADILSLQVTRWRWVAKSFLKNKEKFPERFYIIRYEDLVQKQEDIFRELCKFLDIPYDPLVFDFFTKKDEFRKLYSADVLEKYHKNLLKPINTGRMGLWKNAMDESQVRIADQIAGKYADLLGYERRYKRFDPLIFLKTRPMTFYNVMIFNILKIGSYLPAKTSLLLSLNLLILVKNYNLIMGKKKADQKK